MGQTASSAAVSPAPPGHQKPDPPIIAAVKRHDLIACKDILQAEGEAVLQERDWAGHTAAHWAAQGGNVMVLEWLHKNGGASNAQDPLTLAPSIAPHGFRPIHCAVARGHTAAVRYLLSLPGSDVDSVDKRNSSPLIIASQFGFVEIVDLLLAHGANPRHVDTTGDTPVHWAANKGNREVLCHLLAHMSQPHPNTTAPPPNTNTNTDTDTATPPQTESQTTPGPTVTVIGFDLTMQDSFGHTPLHLAAAAGHVRMARFLLNKEPRALSIKDNEGRTPIAIAQEKNHRNVLKAFETFESAAQQTVPTANAPTKVTSPLVSRHEQTKSTTTTTSKGETNASKMEKGDGNDDGVGGGEANVPVSLAPIKEGTLRILTQHALSRHLSPHYYFVLTRDTLEWYDDSASASGVLVGRMFLCDVRPVAEEEVFISLMPIGEGTEGVVLVADDTQERDNWFSPMSLLAQDAMEFA